MKKFSPVLFFALSLLTALFTLPSCSRINESTRLGDDLIPPVDNINTFEKTLSTRTNNFPFQDSTQISFTDDVAIGSLNDPEFGQTKATAYFDISSTAYRTYPFLNRDSVNVDSVVLSLSYRGAYGDTNSQQTLRVFELSQNSGFSDSTLYGINGEDFATTGAELGSRTFSINTLDDTVTHIRRTDTVREANVIRIRLNKSLGERFSRYDTSRTPNGGFFSDTLFKRLFRGFAIRGESNGNALTYINPADNQKTKMTVYFRVTRNGRIDTTVAEFVHISAQPQFLVRTPANFVNGMANIVKRTPAGNYATYLNNGMPEDDKLYIQSTPGSYGTVTIPGLDTFSNKIIHRAELIFSRLPSTMENFFTPPSQLMLDHIGSRPDSAFLIRDLNYDQTFIDYPNFGGILRKDNTYRFNITRHVQSIITDKRRNNTLRVSAPLSALMYDENTGQRVNFPVNSLVGRGRVVLGGGNFADPSKRVQLRIIYSNL